MFTASNSLSFIRAPLAFLFLQENPTLRMLAVLLAMITDMTDGHIARRSQSTSRFGAILDPAMDKFFVYFAMMTLLLENKMESWEALAMLSRDFFLIFYGLIMVGTGRMKHIVFRAIRWGKITTALQFLVLIGILLNVTFPWYLFVSFAIMGWLAFLELFYT